MNGIPAKNTSGMTEFESYKSLTLTKEYSTLSTIYRSLDAENAILAIFTMDLY